MIKNFLKLFCAFSLITVFIKSSTGLEDLSVTNNLIYLPIYQMIELIKILHPHPALLLIDNNEKHIVISDLHIGFEERFTKKGISIQSSTTNMQNVLRELIIKEKPNDVIILGDIKDSFVSVTKSERIEVPRFFREISKLSNIRVIPGNHDGNIKQLLPNNITVEELSKKEIWFYKRQ